MNFLFMNPVRIALLAALAGSSSFATVKVPAVFSDHMVLQADMPLKIWGTADPGETVTVTFAGNSASAIARKDGRWSAQLSAPKLANAPQSLRIKGPNEIVINDVLVGEVWLASGQSNMNRVVRAALNPEAEIAAAQYPETRMFIVKRTPSRKPEEDCPGAWFVCSPQTVDRFSAVAYFFARELHGRLKVPVGVLHSSLGGTDIAAWTSEEAQAPDPDLQAAMDRWHLEEITYEPAAVEAAYQHNLSGWTKAVEAAKVADLPAPSKPRAPIAPRQNPNRPGNLFNGMIAPIINYPFRGAIWYQGEHNCANVTAANLYRRQLPLLIADWRKRAGREFPFAWVQLPNYQNKNHWALVREGMLESLRTGNSGMAITIDVGDSSDLHPKNKQAVGHRLAQWALGSVYGAEVPAVSGPIVSAWAPRGHEMLVQFKHTEGGLVFRQERPKGFVIAGQDRVWLPAAVRIEGETLILSHPDIPEPAAVRYAFENNPVASLYNGANLPASPFRTDRWPVP